SYDASFQLPAVPANHSLTWRICWRLMISPSPGTNGSMADAASGCAEGDRPHAVIATADTPAATIIVHAHPPRMSHLHDARSSQSPTETARERPTSLEMIRRATGAERSEGAPRATAMGVRRGEAPGSD